MERIVSSETSALKAQMPGDYPKHAIRHSTQGESLKSRLTHLYGEKTARHVRLLRSLTTKTATALHHLFLYQAPPLSHPLIGSKQLWAKYFPYLYPSNPILSICSTLYACEDGTDSKFRNVGTKNSDAGRLPKKHNTAFNIWRKFEIKVKLKQIYSDVIYFQTP